jgi:NAD(P)-dependent dehydrogenase (short-subunit alcohol dehydrogenase family)
MSFSLAGRTLLITGASSGIGAQLARSCAAAGANVVLAARRVDRIAGLAAELGDRALAVAMDVTDEASTIVAYDAAEARFGVVDSIIANAGVAIGDRSTEIAARDIQATLNTNMTGAFLTAREGAKRLIASGSRDKGNGRIVLIGSITAMGTGDGDTIYAASKAGVAHLGRLFARDWVRMGINVNVVQPGWIETEIMGDLYQTDLGKAQIAGFHRRRLVPIDALDDMVIYFASDASARVTGAVMTVDDGQSL